MDIWTTHTELNTFSSLSSCLPGYCLLQPGYCAVRAGKALASGVGTVAQKSLSLLWILLAAPGLLHFILTYLHLLLFSRATWSHHVLIPSLNVFKNVFNPPREGRQGTRVVSCNRMVPAGVCHVSPQRLLSDTVRIRRPSVILTMHRRENFNLKHFLNIDTVLNDVFIIKHGCVTLCFRCLPKLWKLLLFLLPLLLLLGEFTRTLNAPFIYHRCNSVVSA